MLAYVLEVVCFLHVSLPQPHSCHMPRPSHLPWFDNPHNIRWAVQIMRPSIMQFSPVTSYFPPLGSLYSLSYAYQHNVLCSIWPLGLRPLQVSTFSRAPWRYEAQCFCDRNKSEDTPVQYSTAQHSTAQHSTACLHYEKCCSSLCKYRTVGRSKLLITKSISLQRLVKE